MKSLFLCLLGLFFSIAGIGGLYAPQGDKSAWIIVAVGLSIAIWGGATFVRKVR